MCTTNACAHPNPNHENPNPKPQTLNLCTQWVFKWRLQAEESMIAKGKAGMSVDGIRDFVARFIPAYTAYLPGLYKNGPTTATTGNLLTIEVDEKRSPVREQSQN